MKIFDTMGRELEAAWSAHDCNEEVFPRLASRVLRDKALHLNVTPEEILRWMCLPTGLPPQLSVTSSFGEPPVTIFASRRFVIDVYFWLDGTTNVHQHGFCGAFQVLSGSSIHGEYRWTLQERINSRMLLGELRLASMDMLKQGDIREIHPGAQYIHSLFHLDRPSTSVVVRTVDNPEASPQYSYRKPTLAIDPHYREAHLIRAIQALALMDKAGMREFETAAGDFIDQWDFYSCFLMLESCLGVRKRIDALAPLLERARRRHGSRVDTLLPVFQHSVRESQLIARRATMRSADSRFFLALLLNAASRADIFRLILQRAPGCEPVSEVLRFLGELPLDVGGTQEGLHFYGPSLRVLECLLRGATSDDIIAVLQRDYPDAATRAGDIRKFCQDVSHSTLLKPLFS